MKSIAEIRQQAELLTVPPSECPILVVDDEPGICDFLRMALEDWGFPTTIADSAEKAVAALRDNPVRLGLIDKNLPDGTGIDFIRDAKREHPDAEFMIMTGYSSVESAVEAMDAGAFSYIVKPFNLSVLHTRIDAALEKTVARQRAEFLLGELEASHRNLWEQTVRGDLAEELVEDNVRARTEQLEHATYAVRESLRKLEPRLTDVIDLVEVALADKRLVKRFGKDKLEGLRYLAADLSKLELPTF